MRARALCYALWALILVNLMGCAGEPPYLDYTLATVALKAARSVEAARYAPGHWHNAEESYRSGEKLWKQPEFEAAKEQFIRARMYAERAENVARITKFKEGEAF